MRRRPVQIVRRTVRAALLLEVVVALAIMVAAMGVLGTQLVSGLQLTGRAEELTRAAGLADRLLALVDLDPKMQDQIQLEQQADGSFGDQYPGWFWQITMEPTETTGLGLIRVEVLLQDDPDNKETKDGARFVYGVSLLRAAPGRINLVQDFGADEEQVAQLAAMMPMADFDPTNVDPQQLVALATENPTALLELLPALMPMLQQFMGSGGSRGTALAGLDSIPGLTEDDLNDVTIDQNQLQALLRLRAGGGPTPLGGARGGGGGPPDGGTALGGGAPGGGRPGGGGGRGPGAGGQPGGNGGRGQGGGGFPGGRGGAGQGGGGRGGAGPGGGGGPGGGRPGGGGAPGGNGGGRPGQGNGGTGEQPHYTIEDLLRLRDQMQQGGR